MSEVIEDQNLLTNLEEMRQEELGAANEMFWKVWKLGRVVGGRVVLMDNSSVNLTTRDREGALQGPSTLVINHEYNDLCITENGSLIERPVADKFAIDGGYEAGKFTPQSVALKQYNRAEEVELSWERNELTVNDEAIQEFLEDFDKPEEAERHLSERITELGKRHTWLIYNRDRDLPDKPESNDHVQLNMAFKLRKILEQVVEVLPRQVARAELARDADD